MERRKPIVGVVKFCFDYPGGFPREQKRTICARHGEFESNVRRKRFSAHVAMKRMKSVPDEPEKSTSEIPKCFFFVGAEGVEPPTLCL